MSAAAGRRPPLDPASLVRPEVRALAAYHLEQTSCRFKLDQNELPWEPPRAVKEEAAGRLLAARWARYPDFHADALRRELGKRHRWPFEGVLVGNGSNELLAATVEAVAGPGREVLGLAPGFGLYPAFAGRSGARYRALGPRPDLRLPLAELAAEVERDPRRPVILCTPNNPTGEAVPPERVERLLERLAAPLLLDNAYGEFCRWDYRPLLARHPHLVIFRTFSKAWSLAGLRLGYLLARPELVAELIKVKLPYNLGHAGIAAGRAVLAAAPRLERRVRVVIGRRPAWAGAFSRHGLTVLPSEANFILVRCGDLAERLRGGLAERGILVRDVGRYPGMAGCLRVTVAGGVALRAVERALGEILPAGVAAGGDDDRREVAR